MDDRVVLFTGGFDPVHSGHISAIKEASSIGKVVIGLNSDSWLSRKKGKPFLNFSERKLILEQFKDVLLVIDFDDTDNTASNAIEKTKLLFPNNTIVFINGGDRSKSSTPEYDRFRSDPKVQFIFGVGGDKKKNSSSWILRDWKSPETVRFWGSFLNYYESPTLKVKRLVIDPGKSISMQYHQHRSELWLIESGEGVLYTVDPDTKQEILTQRLCRHNYINIPSGQWHRLSNPFSDELCVVEIQYGNLCSEDDIIRK